MSFFKRLFGKKEEPKKEVVLEGQLDNVGQEELEELEEVIEEAIQEQVEEVIEEIVQEQVE
ncbi:MAG: hypothetical protein RR915_01220, partial [Cellulosilyticaceae bacterium]